jgi:hypothetical protein
MTKVLIDQNQRIYLQREGQDVFTHLLCVKTFNHEFQKPCSLHCPHVSLTNYLNNTVKDIKRLNLCENIIHEVDSVEILETREESSMRELTPEELVTLKQQ